MLDIPALAKTSMLVMRSRRVMSSSLRRQRKWKAFSRGSILHCRGGECSVHKPGRLSSLCWWRPFCCRTLTLSGGPLLRLPCQSLNLALQQGEAAGDCGTEVSELSTTSRVWSPMDTFGALLISWPISCVFFKLIVGRNSGQAATKQSMSSCNAASEWTTIPASSAEGRSLMSTRFTIVFAQMHARLRRPSSFLV